MESHPDQIATDYDYARTLLREAAALIARHQEAPEATARLLRGALVSIRDARQAIEDAARLLPKE